MNSRLRVRTLLRWLAVGLIVTLPLLAPPSAQAHALLESSLPADGANVDRPPTELRLTFSENVTLAATAIEMFDGAGRPIDLERAHTDAGAAEATVLRIPLPALGPDRYLVRWHTISSDDLHPTEGSLVFGIGTEVNPANADSTSGWDRVGGAAEALLRWVALMSLGIALAARLLTSRTAARGAASGAVLPRATTFLAGAGALASLLLGLLYLGRIASVAGLLPVASAWQFTLRWVVAWSAAGIAWMLIRRETCPPRGRASALPIGALTIAIVAVTSVSHPAADGAMGAALGAVHTVSTLVWACGAAVVAVVAVPHLRRHDREPAVAIAKLFTPFALVALPISLVSGLLLAGRLLPSVGALLNTDYGHALLVKMGLVILGLLAAAGTVLFLVIGRGGRRLAQVVAVEAVVLGLVVLAASWTAATHPASPVVWGPSPERAPTAGVLSAIADDLVLTVDVGPGRPGRNFATIGVLDTRRPAPAPIAAVGVGIGHDAPLSAVSQGNGEWVVAANLPDEGPASLIVTVTRPGLRSVSAPFTWVIGPTSGTRLGGSALAPTAQTAALLVLVAAAIGLILVAIRRRRRRSGQQASSHEMAGAQRSPSG
jgi:copper transport protein